MKTKIKGFTLVELVIVITILAILATIAFISFQSYTKNARDSVRLESIKNIEKGLDIFNIKSQTYPTPDEGYILTGSSSSNYIVQGVVGDSVSKQIGLTNGAKDPLSGEKYVYSILSNKKNYQIGGMRENKNTSFLNNVYADNSSVIIEGNYSFNPTLPSLILVKDSVNTSSGIFDSNVCFIVDNGENNFSSNNSNCTKKSDMNLGKYDDSLIGYWDMQTYYQTSFSGKSDVVFLKDLSGNGYDMALSNQTGYENTTNNVSGSIFTGSSIGNGIKFDNTNLKLGLATIKKGQGFTYNGRKINNVSGIFGTGINSNLGISAVVVFDYDRTLANDWSIKRVFSFGEDNIGNVQPGDDLKGEDGATLRFWDSYFHSAIGWYDDGTREEINTYSGLKGCGNKDGKITGSDGCWNISENLSYFYSGLIDGKNIAIVNIDIKNKKYTSYLNGNKIIDENMPEYSINRLLQKGYDEGYFSISSEYEPFAGTIYDVKLYKRPLTQNEISQQTRSMGF